MVKILAAALVACGVLGVVPGCADDFEPVTEVLFRGQHVILPGFVHDSGFQPASSSVQVKAKMTAAGTVKAEALGQATEADGPIKGIRGTGKLTLDSSVALQVSLKIDAPGAKFEGQLKTPTKISLVFAGMTSFDPFLLGTHQTLIVTVPKTKVATIPLDGQVPGTKGNLIIHLGGKLAVEFYGVCAKAAAGIAGYSARTVTSGDLTITAGGQITIQGKPSDLPTTTILAQVPATKALMDLGSRPVRNGVAPGKGPCAVPLDAGPADSKPGDTSPDSVADLVPLPDAGSCSSAGGGTGSLCKQPSDCKCPGTCLKVFKDAPGSCWTWCDPTKTDSTTGQNPACKNTGYGEVCHGGVPAPGAHHRQLRSACLHPPQQPLHHQRVGYRGREDGLGDLQGRLGLHPGGELLLLPHPGAVWQHRFRRGPGQGAADPVSQDQHLQGQPVVQPVQGQTDRGTLPGDHHQRLNGHP